MRKSLFLFVLCTLSISAPAFAAQPPASAAQPLQSQCAANYNQTGNFLLGRKFSTWAVARVAPGVAFMRIAQGAVAAGLILVSSSKDAGVLSFKQENGTQSLTSDNPSSVPWNVAIVPDGSGSKITVNKQTPPSAPASKAFEIKSMCSIITTAANAQ